MTARVAFVRACLWSAIAGLALVWACDRESSPAVTAPTTPHNPTCPPFGTRPGGACCQVGQFADPASGQCVALGLAACASTALAAPDQCEPRWCFDPDPAPCDPTAAACPALGHACAATEVAAGLGCAAGAYPDGSGGCRPAGAGAYVVAGLGQPPGATEPPPLPPLVAPPLPPQWCPDDSGWPQPCPAGCAVGEVPASGGACAPLEEPTWKCPKLFVAVPEPGLQPWQVPRCVPAAAACGNDAFAGLQDAPGRVFVLAATSGPADGARAKPFATLTAAVAAAPPGGEVVVGEGIYPESILIDKPLTVRGRCPYLVAVVAQASGPALRVKGSAAQGVVVRDLSLGGSSFGLYVDASATVAAASLFVTDATGGGLVAAKSGSLVVTDSVVAGTTPGAPWHGQGAWVTSGGQLTLTRVRLSHNHAVGALVVGLGAAITATDVLVDDMLPGAFGQWGRGFDIAEGANATLTDVRIVGVRDLGLRAGEPGTHVVADRLHVRHTRAQQADGKGGDALHVRDGALLRARHVRLTANRRAGVFASGAGAAVHLGNAVVVATITEPGATQDSAGVAAESGGLIIANGLEVAQTGGVGLYANGKGARLTVHGGLVRDTLPSPTTGLAGYGAVAQKGGWLTLAGVRLHHNRQIGVSVHSSGSLGELADVTVTDTQGPTPEANQAGIGVKVSDGASCAVNGVRVSRNAAAGIVVADAGSALLGQQLVVDRTESMKGSGAAGYGLSVRDGAAVDVRTVRLHANRAMGVFAVGADTRVVLRDALIDGTLAREAGNAKGFGIASTGSARVALFGGRLHANRGFAVLAQGATGSFVGRDLWVTGTVPDTDLQVGRAFAAELGARFDLRGVRVAAAIESAVLVVGGSQARLVGVRTDTTLPDLDGVNGMALACFDHGKLDVQGCRFAGSHTAGILFEN